MRHHYSESSVVQKSQSQQIQSSWACTESRTFGNDRLAVFCLGDVPQRRDSRHEERPIAENGGIERDKDAGKDIETNANDKGSDSTTSCQQNRGYDEPYNPEIDHSQDQNIHSDHNGNGKDNSGDDNKNKAANDANRIKINRLIEKIENSIKKRKDDHDERTHTWIQTLWEKIDFFTSAQWDFDSLVDSAENDPVRVVLHKMSLYRNLNARIEQGVLRGRTHRQYHKQYKREMMEESLSFRGIDSKVQESKRRLFDLYLQQGALFDRMCTLCAGLVGLVAPILTTSEYGL